VKSLERSLPADDPVKSTTHFFAPGLNPDLGPVLWLDVFEGSEGQLINAYVTEVHQEQTLNGTTLWIDRERCNTRFVLRHPQRENTWIVIGDQCPSLPGNEGYARALEGVVDPLIGTVNFW
jgi:hypothetical protein